MGDIGIDQKETFFVAVKVFLKKNGKFLILKDRFDDWDLPGGRIKKNEFEVSLEKVIARKLREELGDQAQYKLDPRPVLSMRHERIEQVPGNPTARIFAVAYEAELTSGEIRLSDSHKEMLWVESASFKPKDYFTGGWLKGVEEYLALQADKS